MKKEKILFTFLIYYLTIGGLVGCGGETAMTAVEEAATQVETSQVQETAQEDSTVLSALCLTELNGSVTIGDQDEPVTLGYYQEQDGYFCCLSVFDREITILLPEDYRPDYGVPYSLNILDVNQDGCEDILVGLGSYGMIYQPMDCYVCSPDRECTQVPGFADLPNARWMPKLGMIAASDRESSYCSWTDHYVVEGQELVWMERLTFTCEEGGTNPCYTVEQNINGQRVTAQDHVPDSQVDWEHWLFAEG